MTSTQDASAAAAGLDSERWSYAPTARFLHWSLALLIPFQVGLGWTMMSLEDRPGSERLFDLHKSIGLVLAFLILWRSAWRLSHSPAALPRSVPRWQARAARASHWLLYASMVLVPLTGYLGASFSSEGVALFGWPLPAWERDDHAVREFFFSAHAALTIGLVALVGLHIVAALKHLMIDRDGTFQRMWKGRARR